MKRRINKHRESVVETVDGRYMILVDGIQWGPTGTPRDKSGAADTTYATRKDALDAFLTK